MQQRASLPRIQRTGRSGASFGISGSELPGASGRSVPTGTGTTVRERELEKVRDDGTYVDEHGTHACRVSVFAKTPAHSPLCAKQELVTSRQRLCAEQGTSQKLRQRLADLERRLARRNPGPSANGGSLARFPPGDRGVVSPKPRSSEVSSAIRERHQGPRLDL